MSEHDKDETRTSIAGTLTAPDFAPSTPIEYDARYYRELIEGLRALPNVSEMVIIKTISELDRMASHSEGVKRKREMIFATAMKLAEQWVKEEKLSPETLTLMKATGGVPAQIMQKILEDVTGPQLICQCPNCIARRAKEQVGEQTAPDGTTLQ